MLGGSVLKSGFIFHKLFILYCLRKFTFILQTFQKFEATVMSQYLVRIIEIENIHIYNLTQVYCTAKQSLVADSSEYWI